MKRAPVPPHYGGLLEKYGLTGVVSGPELFHFRKGEHLVREGVRLDHLLYVVEGRVKVTTSATTGKTLLICFYVPGNVLGNIEALQADRTATANAQAATDTTCIAVPIEPNREYFRGSLPFLNHLCLELATTFARSSKNNALNILYPLQTRLCSYISMTQENGIFHENLTEVSELLGASYRHLLRTIEKLCAEGILTKGAQGYTVSDPHELDRLAGDYYSL